MCLFVYNPGSTYASDAWVYTAPNDILYSCYLIISGPLSSARVPQSSVNTLPYIMFVSIKTSFFFFYLQIFFRTVLE